MPASINVRLWRRSSTDGTWWPDGKKGISIRIRELPDFADAIGACLDRASDGLRGPAPTAGQRGRHFEPGNLPAPSGDGLGSLHGTDKIVR